MRAETFLDVIGSEFYTGVPDSQLKALCDCLTDRYGTDGEHHIIGANEGNTLTRRRPFKGPRGTPYHESMMWDGALSREWGMSRSISIRGR